MTILVTALLYSGRPDPTWELTEKQATDLIRLLQERRAPSLQISSIATGILGYRGFEVQSFDTKAPSFLCFDGLIETAERTSVNYIDQDSSVENFLLQTASALSDIERQIIDTEIRKNLKGGPGSVSEAFRSTMQPLVPPYDPGKWNIPNVQPYNNCYNYGNDKITNTFAQPGRGSGSTIGDARCATVGPAAQRDGLRSIPNVPAATPADGHYVALVSSDSWNDYHWYRLDNNMLWSHKPGRTAATNLDNSGRTISDPRTCNRGPYNNFCGYFHCIPSQTTIR